ncbi:hypothetical protein ACFL60_00410 [Candidatus Omnitrophota bacterium]
MNEKNRRKKFFANKLHMEIFLLVFSASVIPVTIVTIALYYLIFGITADQLAIPEIIAYNIMPASARVITILLFATPASILILLFLAYKISHKIVGPFDRIVQNLDDCISGKRKGPITLRKGDKFQVLVEKINKLLDKK